MFDFRSVSNNRKSRIGTTSFEAPEVFFGIPKTFKSDVYSFGMIMYELLYPNLAHPWASTFITGIPETISAAIGNAVKCGKRPPVEEESRFTRLMKTCWDEDPDERHNASDLNMEIVLIKVHTTRSYFWSHLFIYVYIYIYFAARRGCNRLFICSEKNRTIETV